MSELFDESLRTSLLEEFLSENIEILRRLEGNLIFLESSPDDVEWIHAIFRDMHTLKGSCRMLGFQRLEELFHWAESLLGEYREGRLQIDRQGAEVLYRVVDETSSIMPHVVQSDSEEGINFSELIEKLRALLPAMDYEEEEPLPAQDVENTGKRQVASPVEDRTVKLSMDRLDFLINLIGELSAQSSQLRYEFDRGREYAQQVIASMEGHIRDLQHEVLQYRLQPIGGLWKNYHRLVRDLAVETGKVLTMETEGEQTQVDRSVLSVLKEVFGHLIRNAVDHGLESAEERLALAKPRAGRIFLRAESRHGQVYIQITDDGRGMAVDRIKEKAVITGLITPQRAMEISEAEALQLIFEPGFTTADQVGRISGRGAGMDAVKVAVEKVRGTVDIETSPGQGTTILIRIPQTMAIVPALMVHCQEAWYGIPEAQVVLLLSFYGEEIRQHIEGKLGKPMVRVHHNLVPLAPLSAVFHNETQVLDSLLRGPQAHVVILQGEGGQFGLAVESIGEITHLLVKPLSGTLTASGIFSGAVVMGNGQVSLLLDVVEVGRIVMQG